MGLSLCELTYGRFPAASVSSYGGVCVLVQKSLAGNVIPHWQVGRI